MQVPSGILDKPLEPPCALAGFGVFFSEMKCFGFKQNCFPLFKMFLPPVFIFQMEKF